MGNIGWERTTGKAAVALLSQPLALTELADGTTYHIDTIATYSPRWWQGAINAMRHTLADAERDCQGRRCSVGTEWALHHPTESTRRLLAGWQREGRDFKISKSHVARDEVAPDVETLAYYMQDLGDGLRLKWAVKAQQIWFNPLNFYLRDFTKEGRLYRNCLVYRKGLLRVRTELRLLDFPTVRRNGLHDMAMLPAVDLQALFAKHLRVRVPY